MRGKGSRGGCGEGKGCEGRRSQEGGVVRGRAVYFHFLLVLPMMTIDDESEHQ